MKDVGRLLAGLLFLSCGVSFGQFDPKDFEAANSRVIRLPPSRFSELPTAIRHELDRRGCSIPQVWGEKKPHNVIQGSFLKKDELDWAALCSVHHVSSVLVFRNSSAKVAAKLAGGPDINSLQGEGGDKIGYGRAISPVGRGFIMRHFKAYGGPKPPPLDHHSDHHQGIDDAFVGKGSVVRYFYRGKWLELTGSD